MNARTSLRDSDLWPFYFCFQYKYTPAIIEPAEFNKQWEFTICVANVPNIFAVIVFMKPHATCNSSNREALSTGVAVFSAEDWCFLANSAQEQDISLPYTVYWN